MSFRVLMVLAIFAVLCGCDLAGPTPEEQAKNAVAGRSEPAPSSEPQPLPDSEPAPEAESVTAPAPVEPVPAPEPDPGRCPPTLPFSSDCAEE